MTERVGATREIVGICLLRNEANFAGWALRNALNLCDKIIVIDNRSTDATPAILADLAASDPRIEIRKDSYAAGTNRHVQSLIGQHVWVLGVDGDEILDTEGLRRLRRRLLAGEFDRYWRLLGHTINATTLDLAAQRAEGYCTPVSWPAAKLYNFSAIESWHANTQRLHGAPVLRQGYAASDSLSFADIEPWADGDFRCLHLCFFPRSGEVADAGMRLNITDRSFRNVWRRLAARALSRLKLDRGRVWAYLHQRSRPRKLRNYVIGPETEVAIGGFGDPLAAAGPHEEATRVRQMLDDISRQRRDGRLPRVPDAAS